MMMSASGNPSSSWSFEPIELVVEMDGGEVDVRLSPAHPLLSEGARPVRGVLLSGPTDGNVQAGRREPPAVSPSAVSPSAVSPSPRQQRRPDHRGRITVIRRPTAVDSGSELLDFSASIPDEPKEPLPIPWSSVIPSMLGGAVVALLFSPLFAVLAGVGVAGLIGRSLASRFSNRRGLAARERAIGSTRATVDSQRVTWARREETRLISGGYQPPSASDLTSGVMPWSCRLGAEDSLPLEVGIGDLLVRPRLGATAKAALATAPQLLEAAARPLTLINVPIVVDLDDGRGLAICGDRDPVLGVIRSLSAQLAVKFGPSDLGLVVLTTSDRLSDWDWVKWVPSLVAAAVTVDEIDSVLASLERKDTRAGAATPALVVVDGVEPSGPGSLARLFAGRTVGARLLWLGDASEIPAGCSYGLSVVPGGRFELRDLTLANPVPQGGLARLEAWRAVVKLVRALAPFEDPEIDQASAALPDRVSHEALYSDSLPSHGWIEILQNRWARADSGRLTASIGLDGRGPLVLDLVEDGPHSLVAGTTGSGKSELLRSLVVGAAIDQPPSQVSFILIDFKGGGAFDLVADLPHVAAVVTDLDPAESSRALRSLQAELKGREELLRSLGCSDVSEIADHAGDGLPRLLIVVDEFAALADELPDFLDGLIDVARRGRSLGVHLVLATQRPAGVVTGQIRANTNLRICLRVQDQSDSMDVIDCADAARLPAVPGRAILTRSGRAPQTFQCLKVEPNDISSVTPFVIHDHLLSEFEEQHDVDQSQVSIEVLVKACLQLCPVVNDAPWLESISAVDMDKVDRALTIEHSTHTDGIRTNGSQIVGLGLLDDPDHRARRPLGWDPGGGGLAVIGSDSGELEATVLTVVGGLIKAGPRSVYVLDGSGGHLELLDQLDSVGAVVGGVEPERCLKLVRHVVHLLEKQSGRVGLIVHRWQSVVDALEAAGGPGAVSMLQRLVRDGTDRGLALVLTGSNDRDIPGRVMAGISRRVIHKLADPAGYVSFGLHGGGGGHGSGRRSSGGLGPALDGPDIVDPETGLIGRAGRRGLDELLYIESLVGAADASPVLVLTGQVSRKDLPGVVEGKRSGHQVMAVPIGLDQDLQPALVTMSSATPTIVLGRPGSGRTTAIETLLGQLSEAQVRKVLVLDNAEYLSAVDARAQMESALAADRPAIVAATTGAARGLGGWLAPLLTDSTIVLINPSRADGEVCRTIVPDLVDACPGRAVLLDHGRSTIIQIAA